MLSKNEVRARNCMCTDRILQALFYQREEWKLIAALAQPAKSFFDSIGPTQTLRLASAFVR